MKKTKSPVSLFNKFSSKIASIAGTSIVFTIAFSLVIIWLITGPVFHFSDTWLLVINTGSGVITFLMVFIIQQAQNKDTLAIQLKLNELIAATKGASNRILNIEDLTDQELRVLKQFYGKLSELSEKEESPGSAHSIDETKKSNTQKSDQVQ
jgi:low affinity Fe/Cu permease